MKKLLTLILIALSLLTPSFVLAQDEVVDPLADPFLQEDIQPIVIENSYYTGKVLEIIKDDIISIGGFEQPYQAVQVEILQGDDKGETFIHEYQLPNSNADKQKLEVGDKVVVVKAVQGENTEFYVAEPYRFPAVIAVFLFFFLLACLIAGKRGFTSLLGLGVSLMIIGGFILPQIVQGRSPLMVILIGSVFIMIISIYLAHGYNKRTNIALTGTLITLVLSTVMAWVVVVGVKLFGLGSEESVTLLQGSLKGINFQGLFLGSMLIGALGVLDDVTTAQSATVHEIHKANPKLPAKELYKRGISVGKEHITSLINTLALAYVGASLPLMLIFTQTDFPIWVIFNSEFIVEEIMRTVVGSTALILAVPITTYLAAQLFEDDPVSEADQQHAMAHVHKH